MASKTAKPEMQDIIGTLQAAGYDTRRLPGQLVPDTFYRFPAPGEDRNGNAGWLKVHDDNSASYGDWRTEEKHTWRAANDNATRRSPLTGSTPRRAHHTARADAATAAAAAARRLCDGAKPASDHTYLTRIHVSLTRREMKQFNDGELAASAMASIILGLGRAVDEVILGTILYNKPGPFGLQSAAAAGLRFGELRAMIGTNGTGAGVAEDGSLRAGWGRSPTTAASSQSSPT